jgi:hypothetical protein
MTDRDRDRRRPFTLAEAIEYAFFVSAQDPKEFMKLLVAD